MSRTVGKWGVDEGPLLDTPSAFANLLGWRLGMTLYALPLVDSWPFWRGDTKYPTSAVEKMYVTAVRRLPLGQMHFFWPQAISAARPFTSDLVAPASRRPELTVAGEREGFESTGGPRIRGWLTESVVASWWHRSRLERGPLDLGVVDGARYCQKVQVLLAVPDLNPASHPIPLL